ncbi:MAG: terminase large subunit domain-containing protein [Acidimicrobiales bacterium]
MTVIESPVDAIDMLGGFTMDNGKPWAAVAADFQWDDARAFLDEDAEQKCHINTRPKGGSKSTDAAGVGLAWLICQAPPTTVGYLVAADEEQARRLVDRMRGFVVRTPGLGVQVDRNRVTGPNGAALQVLAADAASAEGILTPLWIVDELANWPSTENAKRMWVAIISSIEKWPGARLMVICHAGDPAHWAHDVLRAAKADPESWRVHEVPGPLPWMSEKALARQRSLLVSSEFQRRHMNRWCPGEDRLADPESIRACATLSGSLGPVEKRRYVIGLDLATKRDNTVAAVCHLEPTEDPDRTPVVLDHMQVWTPGPGANVALAEVRAWLVETTRIYNRAHVVYDPFNAALLIEDLRRDHVECREYLFTLDSISRLAERLMNLIERRDLAIPDDPALIDELSNVRIRTTNVRRPRIDHDPSKHDDRVIALGLAAEHLAAPRRRLHDFGGAKARIGRDGTLAEVGIG